MDFNKMNGLIPAIIQDDRTNKVLMLGFMNQEALEKTKQENLVTFYSRTKKRLWTKGEESGIHLKIVSIKEDCDMDTLLIKVIPEGPVCHKGTDTCFEEENKVDILKSLTEVIEQRKRDLPENSYTTKLFKAGINKIAQKVGEEAVEVVIEAKDDNKELFLNESADLIYHLLVLVSAKGYKLEDILEVLEKRHSK
jgi:phosphoribosyl-AMP cyclohydrolase / phosphoribosyl-ATP pyrophosphohydrolase